jgi:hypothetical protein
LQATGSIAGISDTFWGHAATRQPVVPQAQANCRNLRRQYRGATAAGIGIGTTAKYTQQRTSGAAGNGLYTTVKYLRGAAGIGSSHFFPLLHLSLVFSLPLFSFFSFFFLFFSHFPGLLKLTTSTEKKSIPTDRSQTVEKQTVSSKCVDT